MNSPLLSAATRLVTPLLLVFGAFMFWRGHNEPGGGFIGGLVVAAAIALCVLSEGLDTVQRALRISPISIMAIGLLVIVASGLFGLPRGFLVGVWVTIPTPLGDAKLGTPILFDLGVFLAVVGTILTFVFELAEERTA